MSWAIPIIAIGCSFLVRRKEGGAEVLRGTALFVGGLACGFLIGAR
jgi:hypothetical protein